MADENALITRQALPTVVAVTFVLAIIGLLFGFYTLYNLNALQVAHNTVPPVTRNNADSARAALQQIEDLRGQVKTLKTKVSALEGQLSGTEGDGGDAPAGSGAPPSK